MARHMVTINTHKIFQVRNSDDKRKFLKTNSKCLYAVSTIRCSRELKPIKDRWLIDHLHKICPVEMHNCRGVSRTGH